MVVSAASVDALKKLTQLMIREEIGPPEFSLRSRQGRIPEEFLESTTGERWLYIDGEELEAYARAVALLSRENELEHLAASDIDEELWKLVCEVFAKKKEYRDERARMRAIRRFVDGIHRPWADYAVIAPVEHLTITIRTLDVLGVRLTRMSKRLAGEFGLLDSRIVRDRLDELLGKVVLIGSVKAGSPRRAAEKGTELLDNALHALRAGLVGSIHARIIDEQLLFRRGLILAVVSTADAEPGLVQWHRPFEPIGFEMRRHTAVPVGRHLRPIQNVICGKFPGPIQTQVARALHWIGTSITRASYDDKVIDLCTALETLLTTRSDQKKGEKIAIRSVLLPSTLGEGFSDPFVLHNLYELRSIVIHGSSLRVCTRAHYERLLWQTGVLLRQYVRLVSKNCSITKPIRAVEAMETPELVTQAIQWFEGSSGNAAKQILKVAREIQGNRQRSC